MNVAQIRTYHDEACRLRIPKFDPNLSPGLKISGLEEYMLKASYARGDLEQAIAWVLEAKHDAWRTLDALVGWEAQLPKQSDRTAERVMAVKAKIDPTAAATFREAEHLLKLLERQVRRLELDHNATSRAYTLITGQA